VADIYSKDKRSHIMKSIRPNNTSIERFIESLLSDLGVDYIKNDKSLIGIPDISFPDLRKVIFVNGCYWHGHLSCRRSKLPSTNRRFWIKKINANKERDKYVHRSLNKMGWKYRVFWQCQLKTAKSEEIKRKIGRFLKPQALKP
jgi:DNA mismatch endonuclease (patch repair protein)